MPWGKHRGRALTDIESSYLIWCLDSAEALDQTLRAALRAELARRFGTPPPPPASSWHAPCPDPVVAARIVTAGRRVLARTHHPDTGGDTRSMQGINAAADWLTRQVPQ